MANTPYNLPTGDFVTTVLNGALSAAATSGTIGTGLSIPAANGVLQVDYDSTAGLGVTSGPETLTYTSYNNLTGALAGIARGAAGTTAVNHINGANVQAGPSTLYFLTDIAQIVQASGWTSWTPVYTGYSANPTVSVAQYVQLGKTVIATLEHLSYGTSNATTLTITLPVAAKSAQTLLGGRVRDNGGYSTTIGSIVTSAGSATATVFRDMTGTAWTAANGKGVDFTVSYQAN